MFIIQVVTIFYRPTHPRSIFYQYKWYQPVLDLSFLDLCLICGAGELCSWPQVRVLLLSNSKVQYGMNEPALIDMHDLCHCLHSTFLILFSVSYCLYGWLEVGMAKARMQMDFHLYNVLGPLPHCIIGLMWLYPANCSSELWRCRGLSGRLNFQSSCEWVISVIRKSPHRISSSPYTERLQCCGLSYNA